MSWENSVVPGWMTWTSLAIVGVLLVSIGYVRGVEHESLRLSDYIALQAAHKMKIVKEQQAVVTKTEIVYRDRIRKIYIKGDTIEKRVPVYITAADDQRYGVNAGFVRLHDAAWSGGDPGPAADSDRKSAGISLAEFAEVEAHNAASCLAWRELAIGLRRFYRELQATTNVPPPLFGGSVGILVWE